jgi:hypothetical protein
MSQVKRFAVEDLSMNLVAHQLTARKNEKTMEGIKNLIILKEVGLLQIKLIM